MQFLLKGKIMAKKKNYDRTGEKGLYHVLSVLMIIDIVVVVLGAIGIGAGTVFSTAIENTFPNVPIVGISAGLFIVAGIILIPMLKARWKFKQAFYDEFGMDENGNYNRKLSGMERREMDVQRIADTERILSREQAEKMSKPGSKNPREDMKKLIGMNDVKMRMEEMVARMEYDRQSVKDKKVKKDDATGAISSRHMCFLGNPGTGKTSICRIMTGFLYENGYIKENKYVETDGNFLKASNPTDTARKTELICRQAYNGVLFIDEAYALNSGMDGCGEEAIATLIKQMEDNRDKFILIIAGYTGPMKQLIDTNPGFESRIKDFLIFPDYTVEELGQIFTMMANQRNLVVTAEGMNNFYERIRAELPKQGFGNARTVRNVLDECIDRHAVNLKLGKITENDRYKICGEDVSRSPKPMFQMHYTK